MSSPGGVGDGAADASANADKNVSNAVERIIKVESCFFLRLQYLHLSLCRMLDSSKHGRSARGVLPRRLIDHHACRSRQGDGEVRGCAENFARFHGNFGLARSEKCRPMRRKIHGSLNSPLCSCVSITLPAVSQTQITASCDRTLHRARGR